MTGDGIERFIFTITSALLIPVLVLALLALALVLVELGRVVVELYHRRHRSLPRLRAAAQTAQTALADGDLAAARAALRPVLGSARMVATADQLMEASGPVDDDAQRAKVLADFDYRSVRALERTRILVRSGPALGLMGTLIPLSPALDALSRGNVAELSQDLRIAFSVTVLGLFIGAVAFGISLIRDRLYSQDLSDLEYIAVALAEADGTPTDEPPADTVVHLEDTELDATDGSTPRSVGVSTAGGLT